MIPFGQGFFILSVMVGRMLLTQSLCLTQAREKNFLLMGLCSVGILCGHSFSRRRGGASRSTPGASRNVPDEVTLTDIYLVTRAR